MNRNKLSCLSALGLGISLALMWCLLVQVKVGRAVPGNILYVAPDGDDTNICDSIPNRCQTVQRAIDVAIDYDDIHVATGIYTSTSGLVADIDKMVTLSGGYNSSFTARDPNAYPTVLDAQRNNRVIYIHSFSSPTIDGFIITRGNAHNASPSAHYGGGIFSSGASPIIQNNTITNNIAYQGSTPWGFGGGIYISFPSSQAVISHNLIISNAASTTFYGLGGGLSLFSAPAIVHGNTIAGNSSGRGGGGVYVYDSDGVVFDGNLMINNTAIISPTAQSYGGGIYIEYTSPFSLTNNIIAQNQALASGGGMYVYGYSPDISSGMLINNTIAENSLEGVALSNNTSIEFINNIIVSHNYGIYAGFFSLAVAQYTLFYNNTTGNTFGPGTITSTNEITGSDPLFLNPFLWDYHIMYGSPAIDSGDPSGVPPAPPSDFDDEVRFMGLGVDIGADEANPWGLFLPLIMKD